MTLILALARFRSSCPRIGIPRLGVMLALVSLFALLPVGASWAQSDSEAGRLIMAIGEVTLARGDAKIPGQRNTVVRVGDTIVTGDKSNAQVRLNDGAIIALRPNTEFKIKEFSYSGKPDGKESASLSLVKGGVRAVTGAIGRTNRDNLKVDAVVATVGIRGTGFNIKFCDAACKSANPTANEGLYAGVFEGRIDVANKAGKATELGVNRFAYVQSENTAPQLLLAPPAFLKDSLEAQVRVQSRDLVMNSATENNSATLESSKAVEKSPTTGGATASAQVTSEKVDTVQVVLEQPDVVKFFPAQFFDSQAPISLGDALIRPPGDTTTRIFAFQSAEFNFSEDRQSLKAENNFIQTGPNFSSAYSDVRVVTNPSTDVNNPNQAYEFQYTVAPQNLSGSVTQYYSIRNAYSGGTPTPLTSPARQIEGGASQGVIAWGRWADGQAYVGNYGTVTFSKDEGIHWISGERVVSVTGPQSWTFNLIGGTTPTEARVGALPGWRLTGGRFDASVSPTGAAISNGVLDLYYARDTEGWGNFVMNFAGQPSGSIATTSVSGAVTRVNGTANLCTGPCGANGTLGFYGGTSGISHAGMTYQFNTGATVVQGAAVFGK